MNNMDLSRRTTMKFCKHCDNMLYIRTTSEDGTDALVYYCKNCMFTMTETSDNLSHPVFDNGMLSKDGKEARFDQFMTESIEHDVTLPRVRDMACPSNCKNNEVVYVKYDPTNMKFLYFCTSCKKFWRST